MNQEKLTRGNAISLDENQKSGKIEVYADYDETINQKGIFGINSGFMYSSPSSIHEWAKRNPKFEIL